MPSTPGDFGAYLPLKSILRSNDRWDELRALWRRGIAEESGRSGLPTEHPDVLMSTDLKVTEFGFDRLYRPPRRDTVYTPLLNWVGPL